MGRNKKKPEYDAKSIMEALFSAIAYSYNHPEADEAVDGHKKMELVADEFAMSRLKIRKILITTRDYSSSATRRAANLRGCGLKTSDIAVRMGLSSCTVTSLLPYEKTVYKLDEISTAAERVQLFRERKTAVEKVKVERSSIALWRAIILFQSFPFLTFGRGDRSGVKFKYTVSKGGSAGRQYADQSVDGYGNEILIEGRDISISRSSVDMAFKIALEGNITEPKQLKIFGSCYVYAIFRRFGFV